MSLSSSCCCPICYKAVVGNDSDPGGGGGGSGENFAGGRERRREVQQRFFRLLERYLENVRGADGGGGSSLQFIRLEQLTEIGMLPCTDCFQVMEGFCDKFRELEGIHLALRGKIWTLKGIMEGVQGPVASSRLKYFAECVGNLFPQGSGGHGDRDLEQVIEAINKSKRELIEKCARKVTGASPQVSISKLESSIHATGKSRSMKRSRPGIQNPVNFIFLDLMTAAEIPIRETDELKAHNNSWSGDDDGEQSPPNSPISDPDSLLDPDPEIKIEYDMDLDPPPILESLAIPDVGVKGKRPKKKAKAKPMKKEKMPKPPKINKKAIEPETSGPGRRSLRQGSKHRCNQCWKGFPTMKDLRLHTKDCHCQEEDSSEDEGGMTSLLKPEEAEAASDTESLVHFSDEYDEDDSEAEPLCDPLNDATPSRHYSRPVEHTNFRLKCPDCNGLFYDVKAILLHRNNPSTGSCHASYDPPTTVRVEVLVPPQNNPADVVGDDDCRFSTVFAIVDLPQAIFSCDDCEIVVYTPEDIAVHRKLHGSFPCAFCNFHSTYAPELARHELRQHGTQKKNPKAKTNTEHVTKCPRSQCKFLYNENSKTTYVRHHLNDHLNLTLHTSHCAICKTDRGGMRRSRVANHMYTHHNLSKVKDPEEDIWRCTIANCDAYFLTSAQLRFHLKTRHSIDDPQMEVKDKIYNCKDCDRSFRSQQSLRKHRLKIHVGLDMTFPCPVEKCPLLFETKEELDRHMEKGRRLHSALENPVKKPALESLLCPKCGKTCVGSAGLLCHLKYHERVESAGERPTLVCETCGKTFKTNKALEKHLPFHDGGPGVWRFTCGVCSKKCLTREKLNCHMRTHTRERPFVCEVCGNSYPHEHTLTIHIRREHGEEHVPKKRKKTEGAGGMEVVVMEQVMGSKAEPDEVGMEGLKKDQD